MKKILLGISILSLVGCSSMTELSTRHKEQKKQVRVERKTEVAEVNEKYDVKMDKLKKKQTVEFTLYLADKLKKLKEFLK